jgi:hypothetical protein
MRREEDFSFRLFQFVCYKTILAALSAALGADGKNSFSVVLSSVSFYAIIN